jgi:hypothetical protein
MKRTEDISPDENIPQRSARKFLALVDVYRAAVAYQIVAWFQR